jgi:hypothetical protein
VGRITPALRSGNAYRRSRQSSDPQLRTAAQADFDSRTLVSIILSGQIALIDKLLFHTSRSFAFRVVGRSHMEALGSSAWPNTSSVAPSPRGINSDLLGRAGQI